MIIGSAWLTLRWTFIPWKYFWTTTVMFNISDMLLQSCKLLMFYGNCKYFRPSYVKFNGEEPFICKNQCLDPWDNFWPMFATSQFLKPIKLTQRSEHLCTYRNNLKINVPLTLTITNGTCEQNFYTSALISFRLCTKCTDSILRRYFIAIPIHIPQSATK